MTKQEAIRETNWRHCNARERGDLSTAFCTIYVTEDREYVTATDADLDTFYAGTRVEHIVHWID